jgi:hypothetical protein
MASFQAQVEGLTGVGTITSGTNPSLAELTDFLVDGVNDVTRRIIQVKPQEAVKFQRESAITDTNSDLDLNGATILSVVREANADGSSDGSTSWRNCRKVPASMQSRVVDTDSLHFASIYNPVYIIDDNGKVNVYPVASANNGYRVFYVNNVPTESAPDATDIDYGSTAIAYFPIDKTYLVVIYAAIKSLEAKMAEFAIDEEDTELVQAITSNLTSLKQQYEGAFASMAPPQPQQQAGGR